MFNSLYGMVTGATADSVLLSTGGIEWQIAVTAKTLQAVPDEGKNFRIYVYLHHKEDQLGIYGFAAEQERAVFLDLIKVSGIGPRQGLRILSGMSTSEFIECLEAGDADGLSRIPGLGKKTAQKIVLALRGKLSLEPSGTPAKYGEIVEGLVAMGFERARAEDAVLRAEKGITEEGVLQQDELEKKIFKDAIIQLSEYQEK